jgi:orotate phosphoribosyltransferase-like protein
MFDYLTLKNKAVSLRKQGKTYSEILKEIKVAKSTLSLWLRCGTFQENAIQNIRKKIAFCETWWTSQKTDGG